MVADQLFHCFRELKSQKIHCLFRFTTQIMCKRIKCLKYKIYFGVIINSRYKLFYFWVVTKLRRKQLCVEKVWKNGLQTYFGLAILNDVPFVQNTVVPADGTEEVNVIPHHVVRCYNQIVLLHLLLNSKIKQTS